MSLSLKPYHIIAAGALVMVSVPCATIAVQSCTIWPRMNKENIDAAAAKKLYDYDKCPKEGQKFGFVSDRIGFNFSYPNVFGGEESHTAKIVRVEPITGTASDAEKSIYAAVDKNEAVSIKHAIANIDKVTAMLQAAGELTRVQVTVKVDNGQMVTRDMALGRTCAPSLIPIN